MIVALAIPVGILAGLVVGGRAERLNAVEIRWGRLAVAGLATQIILFALPSNAALEAVGPALYVLSTGAVFGALLANLRLTGVPVIAAGAASNLAAILANGGHMPTTPEALAAAGGELPDGFSNSVLAPDAVLRPLTDVFAIPAGLPFATVFSVGDVLIAVGIVVALATAMRRTAPGSADVPVSDPIGPRAAGS